MQQLHRQLNRSARARSSYSISLCRQSAHVISSAVQAVPQPDLFRCKVRKLNPDHSFSILKIARALFLTFAGRLRRIIPSSSLTYAALLINGLRTSFRVVLSGVYRVLGLVEIACKRLAVQLMRF